MKKIQILLGLIFVSLPSTTLFSFASYNMGTIWGFNITNNSYYLKNSGTYQATNSITFNTTYLSNTGSITAGSTLNIVASETLSGSGSFSAPNISIKAKTFSFTGSINCSLRCIIKLDEPIHLNAFSANGSGEFLIIDRKNFQQILVKLPDKYYMEEVNASMSENKREKWYNIWTSELLQKFKNNALHLSKKDIKLIYKQLTQCTEKLYLKKSYALKGLKKIADDYLSYYEPLKDKTINETALAAGAVLTTTGVIAGTYGYKKNKTTVGACGGIASLAGLVSLYYGLNPRYKESYERSCDLQMQLAELDK